MTDSTASPTTVAFRNLPADIQALSFDAVGHLPRPMSHMEMLLAVGQAVLAERERAWNAGYLSGFMASGEGWNGEYPFEFRGSPEDDETWIERREEIRRGAK